MGKASFNRKDFGAGKVNEALTSTEKEENMRKPNIYLITSEEFLPLSYIEARMKFTTKNPLGASSVYNLGS